MDSTFIDIYGNEEVVVRDMTLEALEEFIQTNNFRTHTRLVHLVVTGPNGVLEDLSPLRERKNLA